MRYKYLIRGYFFHDYEKNRRDLLYLTVENKQLVGIELIDKTITIDNLAEMFPTIKGCGILLHPLERNDNWLGGSFRSDFIEKTETRN